MRPVRTLNTVSRRPSSSSHRAAPVSPSEHHRLPLALCHFSVTWPSHPPHHEGAGADTAPTPSNWGDHASRVQVLRTLQLSRGPSQRRRGSSRCGAGGHLQGLREAHAHSVRPTAGLQVRPLAGGQHPRVVSGLRKRPLAAAPVGPSAVPLADVPVQDVLDVLHNQVDGDCAETDKSASAARTLRPLANVCPALGLSRQKTHVQAWAPTCWLGQRAFLLTCSLVKTPC